MTTDHCPLNFDFTMKIIVPNTVLPKGAKIIPTVKKEIGGWVEMEFDAKVERFGLTWFRCKGGISHDGDREDWIADMPWGCLSVSDYQFREPRFGFDKFNSFDEACAEIIKKAKGQAKDKANEYRDKAAKADAAEAMLSAAIVKSAASIP